MNEIWAVLGTPEVRFSLLLTLRVCTACLLLHGLTAIPLAALAQSPKPALRRAVNFLVTLPLVFPAVLSGMMLSAAMSLDDVVISFFVTSAETTTLPLKVYTGLRSGGTPEINALSTLMLGVIFICVALSQFLTAKSNVKLK